MQGEFRRWKEPRGVGWSDTIYSGIVLPELKLIITKLSHGLRAVKFDNQEKYRFESVPVKQVEVPAELIDEALAALAADQRFQICLKEYEALAGE